MPSTLYPTEEGGIATDARYAAPRRRSSARYSAQEQDSLLYAGQFVPAGTYRQVDGSRRTVVLSQPDYLPASLDGHVACYERVSVDVMPDKRTF